MASISVITPTIGRATLAQTAASVLPQLVPEDEWIVVADGDREQAASIFGSAFISDLVGGARFTWAYEERPDSRFGNAQRDRALTLVRTSHVCFLDDDDRYEPGALALFRQWAHDAPEAVHVGSAEWGPGHYAHGTVLWKTREFVEGNVGTCMVCYPFTPDMPRWMAHNSKGVTSDFGWMREAAEGREIVWHGQIVATVRP